MSETSPYKDFNYHFAQDFDGLMLLGNAERQTIVESIRQQIKINPGDEKRWEDLELPLVKRLCANIRVQFRPDGKTILSVSDPTLESVLLNYSRGSSWFSSVDLVGAVAQSFGAVGRTL
jgi:hypothetical protein